MKATINTKGTEIIVISNSDESGYISLTDIARYKSDEPKDVIKNWMRSKSTIEFMGLWEQRSNPNFKGVEFDSFRNEAGANAFTLSPQKWIDATNAIGIISKINYRIHTDAIKENLTPLCITSAQQGITYAGETELLNVVLFGKTSKGRCR